MYSSYFGTEILGQLGAKKRDAVGEISHDAAK